MEDTAVAAPQTNEVNIAQAMAKSAVLISGDDDRTNVPNIVTENQPPTETPPAQTQATETAPTTAPKETPAVKETPAPVPVSETPKASNEIQPVKWQEVLKQQSDTEVLKELLGDDSMVKLITHWKSKGDVKPYLEALSTDFKAMSDEDVMRRQLQADYPDMTKEEINDLYTEDVTRKYKMDSELFSADEMKLGKIRLKADAYKARTGMIAQQQEYLLKAPPEQAASKFEVAYQKQQEEYKSNQDAYSKHIAESPVFKDFNTNKKITIGEGETAYNYPVADPNKALSVLTDISQMGKALKNPDGSWNDRKQILFAAFLSDMDGFLKGYADHFKQQGGSQALAPIENASNPLGTPTATGEPVLDVAAQMAKNGRIVSD